MCRLNICTVLLFNINMIIQLTVLQMKEFLIDLKFKMSKYLVSHFNKKKLALAIRAIFHIQKCLMLFFPYRKMKQC